MVQKRIAVRAVCKFGSITVVSAENGQKFKEWYIKMASVALHYVGESIKIDFLTKNQIFIKIFGVESKFFTGMLNFSSLSF